MTVEPSARPAGFRFHLLDELFVVCRLAPDSPPPDMPADDSFVSITRTAHELSIVCRAAIAPESARVEGPMRCLSIVGSLDFAIVGVIARISAIVATAGISIFSISTFDTDHFFIRQHDIDRVCQILLKDGHQIDNWSQMASV